MIMQDFAVKRCDWGYGARGSSTASSAPEYGHMEITAQTRGNRRPHLQFLCINTFPKVKNALSMPHLAILRGVVPSVTPDNDFWRKEVNLLTGASARAGRACEMLAESRTHKRLWGSHLKGTGR